MRKKVLFSTLIILIALLAIDLYYIDLTRREKNIQQVVIRKETPAPVETPFVPTRLVIPSLVVDTSVEHVGKDVEGNMDVPKDWNNVAWYERGFHPGEKGNAVLAGHFDNNLGLPAIFNGLRKVQPGDEIIVLDEANNKKTFVVIKIKSFNVKNPPLQEIFGSSTEPHLNLITCGGTWNTKTRGYDERLVVFTTLKPSPSSLSTSW